MCFQATQVASTSSVLRRKMTQIARAWRKSPPEPNLTPTCRKCFRLQHAAGLETTRRKIHGAILVHLETNFECICTHTHININKYISIYIYISISLYIYMYLCVCAYVSLIWSPSFLAGPTSTYMRPENQRGISFPQSGEHSRHRPCGHGARVRCRHDWRKFFAYFIQARYGTKLWGIFVSCGISSRPTANSLLQT